MNENLRRCPETLHVDKKHGIIKARGRRDIGNLIGSPDATRIGSFTATRERCASLLVRHRKKLRRLSLG